MQKFLDRTERHILIMLENAGYEAYFVGGCVRDSLLAENSEEGKLTLQCSGDVDITTNALPEQIKEVFADFAVLETGIKHGTVTVLLPAGDTNGAAENIKRIPVEITTYRSDGTYSDSRHPDKVSFVRNIDEDLARRDFTINAMACDLRGNIIDPYGGRSDLKNKVIRAVGNPDKRFREDALRIMRGLRFAAVLGFEIEAKTAAAMFANRALLADISAERIFVEFKKLVVGNFAGDVLRRYVDVLEEILPELCRMKGFDQRNPYHKYDVLEHCIRAMEAVRVTPENITEMKMAALFHDIGKPETYFLDDKGIGHFYGHPKKGEEIVREVLHRMKSDRAMLVRVATLVKYHDLLFEKDEKRLKRWMNRLGADVLQEILEIKLADNYATGNMSPQLGQKFSDIREMMNEILAQEQCFSLKDLAVSGRDVIDAGVPAGPEVGRVLGELLEAVIDGECENEKKKLLEFAASIYRF